MLKSSGLFPRLSDVIVVLVLLAKAFLQVASAVQDFRAVLGLYW